MAFPEQSSGIGNEKAAKDTLIIRNAKGYFWGSRIVMLFGLVLVCHCVCVCVCVLWESPCRTWQIQMHMLMGALRW